MSYHTSNVGYSRFSFTRAWSVVNCQLTLAWSRSREICQAATSSRKTAMEPIRLRGHWPISRQITALLLRRIHHPPELTPRLDFVFLELGARFRAIHCRCSRVPRPGPPAAGVTIALGPSAGRHNSARPSAPRTRRRPCGDTRADAPADRPAPPPVPPHGGRKSRYPVSARGGEWTRERIPVCLKTLESHRALLASRRGAGFRTA